jgi:hypothetical protein
MELRRLDFDYSLESERFKRFSYVFRFEASDPCVIGLLKNGASALELMAERLLEGVQFDRTAPGRVTPDSLETGVVYHAHPLLRLDGEQKDDLHLSIDQRLVYEGRQVESASCYLSHTDSCQERLLKMYDGVLALPSLTRSGGTPLVIDKIAAFRESTISGFELYGYI